MRKDKKLNIRNKLIKASILLVILWNILSISALAYNIGDQSKLNKNVLHSSSTTHYTDQWLRNPTFDNSTDFWYSSIQGDTTDVKMNVCNGCANFEILGEQKTFSIVSDPPSATNWTEVVNPSFPNLPDVTEITEYGCRASHVFDDVTAIQNPCVHWDHNVSLPVNISDYVITSASIQSIVNATVDEDLDRYYDYYFSRLARTDPDYIVDTYSIGDYIRFYVLISDCAKNKVYEIAYHQTSVIGSGAPPGKDYLYDTYMTSVPEDVLMFYLTSVLGTDNSNFTISLGIRLFIEDNVANYWDRDTFDELMIKYVNLTFTYEKKIDKLTSLSWNQIGSSLNGNNVEITNAILNFKYKMDPTWINSLTLNSELRVYINNYETDINFNLNSINNTFQELQIGGMDITPFILKNINITISFQLFLADTFVLDRVIKLSLDEVNLEISYTVFVEDPPPFNYLILIIIIVTLIIIAILGTLSFKAYIMVPRKIKKKNYLLRRAQKFKDINNIQAILLMHKPSGLPIYTFSHSKAMQKKDTLFSGFIHAISVIGQEISKEESADSTLKQPKSKMEEQKVIELDMKAFHCLILDIEDLRTVLVIMSKASKRLKQIMFSFALKVYFEIADKIDNFNHDLNLYQKIIPPFLDEYFELYYKNHFKMNYLESDINSIKKKHQLNNQQFQVLKNIALLLNQHQTFKLLDIVQKMSRYDENVIIDAIESLIEKKVILPITN